MMEFASLSTKGMMALPASAIAMAGCTSNMPLSPAPAEQRDSRTKPSPACKHMTAHITSAQQAFQVSSWRFGLHAQTLGFYSSLPASQLVLMLLVMPASQLRSACKYCWRYPPGGGSMTGGGAAAASGSNLSIKALILS